MDGVAWVTFGNEEQVTFLATLVSVWDKDHFSSDSIVIAPGDSVIFGIIYLNTHSTQSKDEDIFQVFFKQINISVTFLCNWFSHKTLLEIPSFIQNNLDQKSPKLLAVILEVCRESDVFILRDLYFNVFSTIFSCFKLSAYLILIKKKVVLIIFLSIHLLFPIFLIFVWKFENYHASV